MENNKYKFKKKIYDMELNEEMVAEPVKHTVGVEKEEFDFFPLRILRVPGGWIYYNLHVIGSGVFVPFDSEFRYGQKP